MDAILRNAQVLLLLLACTRVVAQEPDLDQLLQAEPAVQTEWGTHYAHGEGVRRDPAQAVRLYCLAARSGHMLARYELGMLYALGRGVPRDDALAGAWLELAAEQGDPYARRMLGRLERPPGEPRCLLPDGREYLPEPVAVPEPDREQINQWVRRLAPDFHLPPELVLAVIETESGFDPAAHSPRDARGLMQLLPATADRFGVADIWDPLQNLKGGMAYLRWLLDHFDGDLERALAGYNAGEQAVTQHGGIPPYAETRDYVRRVLRRYRQGRAGDT